MPPGLRALGDDGVHPRSGGPLRLGYALYLGKDPHPARFCRRHIGGGVSKGVVDHRHPLVQRDLDEILNTGEGGDEADAKGPVGLLPRRADLRA